MVEASTLRAEDQSQFLQLFPFVVLLWLHFHFPGPREYANTKLTLNVLNISFSLYLPL